MGRINNGEKISLHVKTLKIVKTILDENPDIKVIFEGSETPLEARMKLREWVMKYLNKNPHTKNYYLQRYSFPISKAYPKISSGTNYYFCSQVRIIIPNLPTKKINEPKTGTIRLTFIPAAITPDETLPIDSIASNAPIIPMI